MKKSSPLLVWLGGTASTPTLGLDLRPSSGSFVNVWSGHHSQPSSRRATAAQFQPSAASQLSSFAPPERRQLLSHIKIGRPQWSIQKFRRALRADIYDELLKLPLRYALHDFDTLERHLMGGRKGRFQGGNPSCPLPSPMREKAVHEEECTTSLSSGSELCTTLTTPSSSSHFMVRQEDLVDGMTDPNSNDCQNDEVSPGVYAFPVDNEVMKDGEKMTSFQPHPGTSSHNNANSSSFSTCSNTEVEQVEDKPLRSASPFSSPYYSVMGHQPSAVGYAPPLGPADPLDTIPFFVHRTSTGLLPGRVHSMDAKRLMPAFYLRIGLIDGDIFRFEEELLKIFPTKKIFVRRHAVYVYNVNLDGKEVLFHWLLGLGF